MSKHASRRKKSRKPPSTPAPPKLIDVDASDDETSDAGESSDNPLVVSTDQHPLTMRSRFDDDDNDVDEDCESQTSSAQLDIVQHESKWSNSGGSVLGLLSTTSDADYTLWVRVKDQKRKQNQASFFTSSILSLLSGPKSAEQNSFDEYLISDSLGSSPSKPSRAKSSQTNRKMSSKSEMQKLMLSGSTNVNLNDDTDDDNDFVCTKKKPEASLFNLSLYKGIFYSSMSSLFFSLSCVIVKYLKNIHPGQLAVARFIGVFVLSIPLVVYHRQSPLGPPEMRHLLVLRGLSGATSLFLRFYAFRYLPIADASVIVFAIPIFVSIFGYFFLNEPCGLFHTFIIVLAMIGLGMTTKIPFLFGDQNPFFSSSLTNTTNVVVSEVVTSSLGSSTERSNHILGVSAGLGSLLFASAVYVFIRKAKGVHYSVIMIWFGAVAIIETTLLTLFLHGFSMPSTMFEWRLMIFLAVFSFCGQILLTRALQLEFAGSVSVARSTSDITFGFLWQISIFNESPDQYSIVGAILVSSCIFFITLKNWVNSLPEHSRIRQKLKFVTY